MVVPLEISGHAYNYQDINLQGHFRFEVLLLFHIFKYVYF